MAVSNSFRQYISLLRQFHALMQQGEDDERGDALRDQMDRHWHSMTEKEREVAAKVSEALYASEDAERRDGTQEAPDHPPVELDERSLRAMVDLLVEAVDPEQVILFGSRARGEEKPTSDVDLMVVLKEPPGAAWSRREETARLYRILAPFRVPKVILVYGREEVERWRHSPGHIVARSLSEGRVLYERQ